MKKTFIIAAILASVSCSAFADETVVKERHDRDGPGVAVKVPGPDVVVKDRREDCATKTVHKEDGAGDSKTVKKTDCD